MRVGEEDCYLASEGCWINPSNGCYHTVLSSEMLSGPGTWEKGLVIE